MPCQDFQGNILILVHCSFSWYDDIPMPRVLEGLHHAIGLREFQVIAQGSVSRQAFSSWYCMALIATCLGIMLFIRAVQTSIKTIGMVICMDSLNGRAMGYPYDGYGYSLTGLIYGSIALHTISQIERLSYQTCNLLTCIQSADWRDWHKNRKNFVARPSRILSKQGLKITS